MWTRPFTRSCPKCKARSFRRDFNRRLKETRPALASGTDLVKIYALNCPVCGHGFTRELDRREWWLVG